MAGREMRQADGPRRWRVRRLTRHGLLVTVGYALSPPSWWNDAFVNVPIAYGLATAVAWVVL